MSDKKKSELSAIPEFVNGEQPSAAKLNSISSLLRREGFVLEKSIGDIWGESEPYSDISQNLLSTPIMKEDEIDNLDDSQDGNGRSLDITSLGRAIGAMSKLNPKVLTQGLSDGRSTLIVEQIDSNVNEYKFKFPVDTSMSLTLPGSEDAFQSSKTSISELLFDGDYYFDENKNTVFCYFATSNPSGEVSYYTTPSKWASGSSYSMSSFNTIPDINQIGYLDLNISQSANGLYEFVFPEVRYTARADSSSASIEEDNVMYGATYTLPPAIRAVCGGNFFTENSGVANTIIPEGMIYLKNATTGEIYSDAVYYYNNDSSVIVEGVELELNDNFYFITVGTDITSCIEDIYNKLGNHTHDNSFGEKSVSVKSLKDIYSEAPSDEKVYFPSTKVNNFFSQYLHRDGFDENDPQNDYNAMRGDLVIGRRANLPGSYTGGGDESYKLKFGSGPTGTSGQYIMRSGYSGYESLLLRSSRYSNDANISQINLMQGSYSLYASDRGTVRSENYLTLQSHSEYVIAKGAAFVADSGVVSASSGSSLQREGADFTSSPTATWYHPKISTMHYREAALQVYGSLTAGGIPLKVSNKNDADYLNYIIFLPNILTDKRMVGVDILASPGAGSPGGVGLQTDTWWGVSSGNFQDANSEVRSGLSWMYNSASRQMQISIPTGNYGTFDKDDLLEDGNGDWYALLDLFITIRYCSGV